VSARTVLVSGASGGVGRGIALACGAAGWEVWIAARRQTEGEAVAAEVAAAGGVGHFAACDVTDPGEVASLLARVSQVSGHLHGVVHNATSSLSSKPSNFADVPAAEVDDHVAVALTGLYLLARAAEGSLTESRGAFVVTTSEAGFEGKPRLAAYASVKAAQRGLAMALAREWGPLGIRVNCVGPLATSPAMALAFQRDPSMEARVMGRIPLGRLGDPVEDIGPVVRFLLSEQARYVTAQTLMIDGGSSVSW
jgi:NAD(P)-dependent dehydrogenase (short-subunit alcohol dehydrogenase family)